MDEILAEAQEARSVAGLYQELLDLRSEADDAWDFEMDPAEHYRFMEAHNAALAAEERLYELLDGRAYLLPNGSVLVGTWDRGEPAVEERETFS